MRKLLCWVVVLGLGCKGESTSKISAEFATDRDQVDFNACPAEDALGVAVQDVFPDEQFVTLANVGRTASKVVLSFEGDDAQAFSLLEDTLPKDLGASAEVKVPIRFAPRHNAVHGARLVIDDGDAETPVITVSLTGTVKDLPAVPELEVVRQTFASGSVYAPCVAGVSCEQEFPNTFFGFNSVQRIRLRNKGCPALKITGATLEKYAGDDDRNLAFYIDEPSALPTPKVPFLLTTSGASEEAEFVIRFAPQDDSAADPQRFGVLRLFTNDPANPEYGFTLRGMGVRPSLSVQPNFCDFSNAEVLCGNSVRVPNEARFTVRNVGSAQLQVESVTFARAGAGGRFSVAQNVEGLVLQPDESLPLVVRHTEGNLIFVEDTLVVNAGAAGSAPLSLVGGKAPFLATEPAAQLTFTDSLPGINEKQLVITNGASAGSLVLQKVWIETSPHFSLATTVAAGTVLPGGGSLPLRVQFKKPVSGGIQFGTLHIESNDARFGAPGHKAVTLYSEAPLDTPPTALLTACLPSELAGKPACSGGSTAQKAITLSTLTAPKELILSGIDSQDASPAGPKPVVDYEFRLIKKPPNASADSKLQNDGLRGAAYSATLTLDNVATGEYQVSLKVYDDAGQASQTSSVIKIYVQ